MKLSLLVLALLLIAGGGIGLAQVPPSSTEIDAYTGLLAAAAGGDVTALGTELDNGADPDMRDAYGRTPLHVAAFTGHHEVMRLLVAAGADPNALENVTGGGQDFVRVYSTPTYGVPPEQVVGTAGGTKYGYAANGKPFLTKEPKLLLNNNDAGKPEGIHLMIGRRPYAAFGNSTGDRQMLEYTHAGDGARLAMLVLHDDAEREYAYGPAQGLADTRIGTFTQALYDEAKKQGWTVVSMKNDWKRIFAFDQ